MAGGSIGGGVATITYSSMDNLTMAGSIANTILSGIASGALTPVSYPGFGNAVPEPASKMNGVAVIGTPMSGAALVPAGDAYVVVNADGPVSLWGGMAGGTLLAGSGADGAARNLTYTNITPTGTATDTIVVAGGNNLIQTSVSGGGQYNIATGSGDDTINALTGNATINAATGSNQINLGSGNSLITSVGFDLITGPSIGGGSDTVNVTSGNTSINSGTGNFLVNDSSPNPLYVNLGYGVDTVNILGGSPATVQGINTMTLTTGNVTVVGTDTPTGDGVTVSGGASTVTAFGASDTVQALSGNHAIVAGAGNDTLIAGAGADTIFGGSGSALMMSGDGLRTTFSFIAGQAGGSDAIFGFKPTDILALTGYGPQPQVSPLDFGTSTILALPDGTTLTFADASPAASQIIIK